MSDKHLTELAWKAHSKGKGYKDAALVKAMAEVERARKGSPALLVLAYDGLDKQADALAKSVKGDKELAAYLAEVQKQVQLERRGAMALAAKAEKEAKEAKEKEEKGGGDDEEDSPAALTTQMPALLRMVKKGDTIHAMVAVAGKACATLLSRKPVGAARRKLLLEYLKNPSGTKFAVGQCIWEENAYTFVLATSASGLAKKLQLAVLEQAGLRARVRVRGEDPNDIDDAGEDEENAAATGTAIPKAPPLPTPKANPALMARLAALQPRIKTAMAGPAGAELKDLVARFGTLAQKADPAAEATLKRIEALLAAAPAATAATPAASAAPAAARTGAVDYAKCRLAWEATKKAVQSDLKTLEQAIMAEYRNTPAYGEISQKIRKLDTVLAAFADDLADILDDALNAAQPAERQKHHRAAAAVIGKFMAHAQSDPFMATLEANPFVPMNARKVLVKTLGELSRQIAA